MKVHELYALLADAIAKGYRDCDVRIYEEDTTYDIVETNLYDLGPGFFQIEVD